MALVHGDFVRETTTTTGTGTLSLAGATTGCRTFASAIGNGNTCYYAIETSAGQFESGIGTVTAGSPDTLARTTLVASSTGSKINLPAGTHIVYCTFSAATTATFEPSQIPVTQAEAEAGTLTEIKSWTPQRVSQAATARISEQLATSDLSVVIPAASATYAGLLTADNYVKLSGLVQLRDEYNIGALGASKTLEYANGSFQRAVLNSNCTISLVEPSIGLGARFVLRWTISGGPFQITWPASNFRWLNGEKPIFATSNGKENYVELVYGILGWIAFGGCCDSLVPSTLTTEDGVSLMTEDGIYWGVIQL